MALYATNRFPGDGSRTSYEFNFVGKYIARSHVKVYQEDNATKVRTPVPITDSNFLNDTTLRGLPVTPVGSTLVIYRDTPKPPLVDFVNGSRFTEYNMDLVARQGLFVAMEALDAVGPDAMQQLRDALAVVGSLINDAHAVVSDATAAALAAATSAAAAQDAVTLATAAQTAAESANTAAQSAKASLDGMQADVTWTRTTLIETRDSLADTKVDVRDLHATITETRTSLSDTKADVQDIYAGLSDIYSELAAVNAASGSGQNFRLVYTGPDLDVSLQRCGGKSIIIAGQARELTTAGITLRLPDSSDVLNIYAYWTGSSIALEYNTVNPQWDSTQGYWHKGWDSSRTYVGSARPDRVAATPQCAVRSAFNGQSMMYRQGIIATSGTWNGSQTQIAYGGFVTIPADALDISASVSVMSEPAARVGDLNIGLAAGSIQLSTARNTFVNTNHWNGYNTRWSVTRGINDPPQWLDPYARFLATSTGGGNWNTLGHANDALTYSAWPAV